MERLRKKSVYVLGPMRGFYLFNFPAFDIARDTLLDCGFHVISPADMDRASGFDPEKLSPAHDWNRLPPGLSLDAVVRRDITACLDVDAYYTLPGWENSVGASAEKALLEWRKAEWLNREGRERMAEAARYSSGGEAGSPFIFYDCPEPKVSERMTVMGGFDFLKSPSVKVAFAAGGGGSGFSPRGGSGGNGKLVGGTVTSLPVELPRLKGDAADRKACPMVSGLLDYFPDALAVVATVSKVGNDQHNAGQPLYWARGKSTDEADCLLRHLVDRGTIDTDGVRHSAKVAWRALALLQKELEAANNLTLPRGAKP